MRRILFLLVSLSAISAAAQTEERVSRGTKHNLSAVGGFNEGGFTFGVAYEHLVDSSTGLGAQIRFLLRAGDRLRHPLPRMDDAADGHPARRRFLRRRTQRRGRFAGLRGGLSKPRQRPTRLDLSEGGEDGALSVADQYARREDQRAAEHHLEDGAREGRLHVAVLDEGDRP